MFDWSVFLWITNQFFFLIYPDFPFKPKGTIIQYLIQWEDVFSLSSLLTKMKQREKRRSSEVIRLGLDSGWTRITDKKGEIWFRASSVFIRFGYVPIQNGIVKKIYRTIANRRSNRIYISLHETPRVHLRPLVYFYCYRFDQMNGKMAVPWNIFNFWHIDKPYYSRIFTLSKRKYECKQSNTVLHYDRKIYYIRVHYNRVIL